MTEDERDLFRSTLFADLPAQRLESDERYTPPSLVKALGRFDLDPCSPPEGPLHGCADTWFSIEDDGLAQPWNGRVFMNPPWSNTTPWADKFRLHGHGVAVVPVANSAWRVRLLAVADAVWMAPDFPYVGQNHAQIRANMPTMAVAMGERADVFDQVAAVFGGTVLTRRKR